jgi:dihydrodipicolinate synthase/N-acetylneuraminate lyase
MTEKAGADAIIAIPYRDGLSDDAHQMEYYSAIGAASSKPLFVQAIGNISVDLVLNMAKRIPTLRYVKDEAGNTLQRLNEYRKREQILTGVFTGKNGPTLLDELARGAIGNMPSVAFADLYVATWKAWKAGNQREAEDMFSKTALLLVQGQNYGMQGTKYMLQARGVFKNTICRRKPTPQQTFDEEAKQAIDRSLAYLKPWLKA